MNSHKYWIWFKEHLNEILILVLFSIILYLFYDYKDVVFTKKDFPTYFTSIVALFGVFLAWLQFIFHKYNKKKEAAISYFPRPLEVERLEGEIDEIINFWTRSEPLDNHEVKLMLGESISLLEYKLIWERLTIKTKKNILNECNCKVDNIVTEEHDEKYNPYIDELYRKTRRKLNAYLNQIEGYCLAINKGNIDLKTAKELFVYKFYQNFRKARPYIETIRHNKNSPHLYSEFETVLKKWGEL